MDRLRKKGATLVYRCAKQHSEPSSDKRAAKVDEPHLTPLELIERITVLVSEVSVGRLIKRLSLSAQHPL
jgi:hypothetical protein